MSIYQEFIATQNIGQNMDSGNCNKFSFVCVGAGISLSQLLLCPGASKHVSAIILPYDVNITKNILDSISNPVKPDKMVSLEVAKGLATTGMEMGNCEIAIGITGALQTNRDRHSEDQCFISFLFKNGTFLNYNGKFHGLTKVANHTEDQIFKYRSEQDRDVSTFVLNTLMHRPSSDAIGEYRRIL